MSYSYASSYTPPGKVRWNVLVFPAGTENALEIWRSLKDAKEVRLFSAAAAGVHHASYVYEACAEIPDVRTDGWQQALNRLVRDKKIDFIIPANDVVIKALAAVRGELEAPVLMPANEVIARVQSKRETLKLLADIVPVPRVFANAGEITAYPVFIKPDGGYGSQGAQLVRSAAELAEACAGVNDPLIQEYLSGEETSVDCFTDRHGKVRFAGARSRERIRMGTSMHSELLPEPEQAVFLTMAQGISDRMDLRGIWFFQMKKNGQGEWRLLEVDVRVAGTMALNRVRGVNFPLLALFDAAGLDVEVETQRYEVVIDRSLLNRYRHNIHYSTVYVDLDDTVVGNGRLNLDMVRFLFQCVNRNKKLVLLTKSLAPDVNAYLERWRIRQVFDEVVVMPEEVAKADHITDLDAIFIDDSFSARKDVRTRHGIPTFDPSMVEMLLDDRI